jgi:hypothetical protein
MENSDEKEMLASVTCPQCRRVLHALRGPHCSWCGAPLSEQDYAVVAEQSRHVMELPDPTPLPPMSSYAQQSEWGWGAGGYRSGFLPRPIQSFRPVTPGQARLRGIVVALFGILAAVKIIYSLYVLWIVHHMIQTMPSHSP